MRRSILGCAAIGVAAALLGAPLAAGASPFLVQPYLQLGSAAPAPDTLVLVWHGPDRDGAWSVQVRSRPGGAWGPPLAPAWTRVAVSGVAAHRVYRAVLRPLAPGARFTYRVNLDGRPVFQSRARARKGPGQSLRVAVLGDLADGHAPSRAMAFQVWRQRPDLVVLPGDLVYPDGRISEYRAFFYPVFNADRAGPDLGAPLLRSTLTGPAAGNRYVDQWMARIWPVLERHRVDLVLTGHIHTYVRTRPLRFTPDPAGPAALDPVTRQGQVTGRLGWGSAYDGRVRTRARGVIHIITGGGGAHLHLKGRAGELRPMPCVARMISREHSFSLVEVRGRRVVFRQLGLRGEELDRFVLTK